MSPPRLHGRSSQRQLPAVRHSGGGDPATDRGGTTGSPTDQLPTLPGPARPGPARRISGPTNRLSAASLACGCRASTTGSADALPAGWFPGTADRCSTGSVLGWCSTSIGLCGTARSVRRRAAGAFSAGWISGAADEFSAAPVAGRCGISTSGAATGPVRRRPPPDAFSAGWFPGAADRFSVGSFSVGWSVGAFVGWWFSGAADRFSAGPLPVACQPGVSGFPRPADRFAAPVRCPARAVHLGLSWAVHRSPAEPGATGPEAVGRSPATLAGRAPVDRRPAQPALADTSAGHPAAEAR